MITELRKLWQEAFSDTDAFLDSFFETTYSPERRAFVTEQGELAAALYWLDCGLQGRRIAYIYAVATAKKHRGKGHCRRLMAKTHRELAERGYGAAVLVPGSEALFKMYEAMGYEKACTLREFSCAAAGETALKPISAQEYALRRKVLLPERGILQEEENLRFLERQAELFAGEDFLLAARREKGSLFALELLGNEEKAPAITAALGCERGNFRTPGAGRDFAMWLPFDSSLPKPEYLGFAFD